jgi:hypothetical protein
MYRYSLLAFFEISVSRARNGVGGMSALMSSATALL